MTLDLWLVGLVFVFGAFGASAGAIRQASRLIGAVVGWFAVGPLTAQLSGIPAATSLTAWSHRPGASWVIFLVVAVVSSTLARFVLSKITGGGGGPVDAAVGFALGAAKGAILVYALVSTALSVDKPLTAALPSWSAAKVESRAVRLVRRYSSIDALPPALAQGKKKLEAVLHRN